MRASPFDDRRTQAAIGVAAIVVYALWTSRFFPGANDTIGHDYRYFLTNLLAGQAWFARNGLFALPMFSPHVCGGLPLLANPQSEVFGLPQLLYGLLGPVASAQATLLVSALTGSAGMGLLLHRVYRVSTAAALLAAGLFLFNGFLTFRLLAGHQTYHVFALLPWMLLLALTPTGWRGQVGASAGIALLVGYAVFGGATNYIVPMGLAAAAVVLARQIGHGWSLQPWLRLVAGFAGGGLVAAVKLVPAAAFMGNFSRAWQPLVLHDSVIENFGAVVVSLFLPVRFDLQGKQSHELEYGVTLVVLVLLFLGRRHLNGADFAKRGAVWVFAALVAVLAIPLAVTSGSEDWARFLKTLPYLRENVILIRWWSIYIPLLIVLAALSFERATAQGGRRTRWLAVALALVAAQSMARDDAVYRGAVHDPKVGSLQQPYNPAALVGVAGAAVPAVSHIAEIGNGRNDRLVEGGSPVPCYEPIFGYALEKFPAQGLQHGPALATSSDGWLNVANPACYVFGEANGCAPGQRFRSDQIEAARAFLDYRPFPYAEPWWMVAAKATSAAAIPLCLLLVALPWLRRRGDQA